MCWKQTWKWMKSFFSNYIEHLSKSGCNPLKVKVKVTQSCPTLCNPMDYTVYGILQARTLEWVAFPFLRGSSQPRSPALQVDSLPAELKGSPRKLEWVAYPFCRGTSQPKNWTRVSYCRRILYQLSYQWVSQMLQSSVRFYLGFLAHIVPNVLFRAWCSITTMVVGLA